ncbi:unnamed protein product [Brassicogethes aeneus]|uniref:Mitoguardin n=1 Tax=Brassicogethes aeneus TaxID=1431903 RepID=A0A9P0FJP7_BRAAE|nr:unnamed protein product [Brassicogethes aeneus]
MMAFKLLISLPISLHIAKDHESPPFVLIFLASKAVRSAQVYLVGLLHTQHITILCSSSKVLQPHEHLMAMSARIFIVWQHCVTSGVMDNRIRGMEALETCISYWEDALAAYRVRDGIGLPAMLGPEEAGFCKDLQQLLEYAIELQENSEMLFLDERSVLFRREGWRNDGLDADIMPPKTTQNEKKIDVKSIVKKGITGLLSEENSIGKIIEVSDTLQQKISELENDVKTNRNKTADLENKVADLREFEEFGDYFPDLESYPLYQAALHQLENGGIPCRTLRTDMVKCGSDGEYLAKLHCLRLAFQHLLRDHVNYVWFADAGRQILADLLLYADKDPKDFLMGYEEMLNYIQEASNWRELEEELSTKGVKALTFYDVVLDYILMDAFEDLDSPPSSVTAVIQNRWLSNGFKETALTTAVWSVLKAKRRKLKFPTGFMAHFYTISEQLSPLLAWGFLGSDELLRDTCVHFKEQVMGFLADIFNFQKCKYTTVEDLAVDVIKNLKLRVENICQRLSPQS